MMPFPKIDLHVENAAAAIVGIGGMAALNWKTLLAASTESFVVAAAGALAVHLVNLAWKRSMARLNRRRQKPPTP